MGLGLGAIYMQAGMAEHVVEHRRAERMTQAVASGYAGSHLEAQGQGLRFGMDRYGLRPGMDAQQVAVRFDAERGAAKARRRADLDCLTQAVYYEARGESLSGQHAVAQVVMNRVKHPAFPKSVCAVVYQGAARAGCQFSFACDGSARRSKETAAWNRARKVATRALAGALVANVGAATHFHTTAVSPFWAPQMLRVSQVGTHVFYKFSPRRSRPASDQPSIQRAVLTSGDGAASADLRVGHDIAEGAIEATLQPLSDTRPASTAPPASKPAEAAELSTPQPAVIGS